MENSRGLKNSESCTERERNVKTKRENRDTEQPSAHLVYRKQISSPLDLAVFVYITQIQIRATACSFTNEEEKEKNL